MHRSAKNCGSADTIAETEGSKPDSSLCCFQRYCGMWFLLRYIFVVNLLNFKKARTQLLYYRADWFFF